MFCKVVNVVGPLAIIGLAWYNPAVMWSQITTTVIAVIIMGMIFCPCRKGGVAAMSSGAAPAMKVKANAKVTA